MLCLRRRQVRFSSFIVKQACQVSKLRSIQRVFKRFLLTRNRYDANLEVYDKYQRPMVQAAKLASKICIKLM